MMLLHEQTAGDPSKVYPLASNSATLASSADIVLLVHRALLAMVKNILIFESFDVQNLPFSPSNPLVFGAKTRDIPITAAAPVVPLPLASPLLATYLASE